MATESSQDFNKRLSQWVASQGFWFQIRYSMFSGGMHGRRMFHLLRMSARGFLFLGIVTIGLWFYLLKRTESRAFSDAISSQLKSGLAASGLDLRGLSYTQGKLEIPRIAAEGGNGTFFEALEIISMRCNMSLIDGFVGTWNTGVVAIATLELDLRAGADDDQSAADLARVIFKKSSEVDISSIQVGKSNIRWGYSKRTQGAIRESSMRAQRVADGWRLTFKGGTFSQNWLKDLEIVNLVAICNPEGIRFVKADLRQGTGSVRFDGLELIAGARPRIDGLVKIKNLNMGSILPEAATNYLEGTISGDFKAFGSTNTSMGVGFEGLVVMDGTDVITLRDELPLLTAFSVMDYSRNYHRIDFTEGSFQLRTSAGGMELTEVDLLARTEENQQLGELFTLKGEMNVRLPTQEEIRKAISAGGGNQSSLVLGFGHEVGLEHAMVAKDAEFTLRRAALEAKRDREGKSGNDGDTIFDRLADRSDMRELEAQASERMSRMLQYEGLFRITIPGDAFERAGELQDIYPMNPETGRIPVEVPIKGNLHELTDEQSSAIYAKGRRL